MIVQIYKILVVLVLVAHVTGDQKRLVEFQADFFATFISFRQSSGKI